MSKGRQNLRGFVVVPMACLLTKRSHVLENQNTVSSEAIMSDLVVVGDYELLEKQKEGYETN